MSGSSRRIRWRSSPCPSVQSLWFATQFPGGASRLAALLLAQILPVSSLVAPCDPGAAPGTYATIHRDGTLAHVDVERAGHDLTGALHLHEHSIGADSRKRVWNRDRAVHRHDVAGVRIGGVRARELLHRRHRDAAGGVQMREHRTVARG